MLKNTKAQDFQDQIFQKMSADQKVRLGSQLWALGKSIAPEKLNYAKQRRADNY